MALCLKVASDGYTIVLTDEILDTIGPMLDWIDSKKISSTYAKSRAIGR